MHDAGPSHAASGHDADASPIARPGAAFLWSHPAHWIALGFGSGLSPKAPGTAGTLWAWLAFVVLQLWLTPTQMAWVVAASVPLGWWACSISARDMRVRDPGSIVWDEVAAFWLVLWVLWPAGWLTQLCAFVLFRFFDAVKMGPVRWADQLFHAVDVQQDRHGWAKTGLGIMLDDLVAAGCTLLVFALWRHFT